MDASNVRRQLREGKEAALQIAYADTLVINKTDLVSEEDLNDVERILTGINAEARVVRSERSVVDLSVVLNQAGPHSLVPVYNTHATLFSAPRFKGRRLNCTRTSYVLTHFYHRSPSPG